MSLAPRLTLLLYETSHYCQHAYAFIGHERTAKAVDVVTLQVQRTTSSPWLGITGCGVQKLTRQSKAITGSSIIKTK